MTQLKVRFGSDEWIDALGRRLEQLSSSLGPALPSDLSVKIQEIVTGAPADIADPGRPDSSRAWHIVLDGGRAFVGAGEIEEPHFGSVSDYNSILRLAQWVYTDDEDDRAAVAAHRQSLEEAGLYRPIGARPELPPAVNSMFRELHNSLAAITA